MSSIIKIIILILLVALFASALWYFNVKILLADYYLRRAIVYRKGNAWPATLVNYEKVLKYQPLEPYYQKRFALDLMWGLDFYQSNDSKIKILDLAIERIKRIPERDQTFEAKTYLARIYSLKAGLTQDENDFLLAERKIAQAAQISPQMAGIYNDWCQIKIDQEKWSEALEICQRAFSLYPDLNNPEMNEIHRQAVKAEMSQVYEKFGHIYQKLGDYEKAEKMYVQVLKFFPLDKTYIWKKIGDLYYLQKDIDTAIVKNFHGYTLNPRDPVWSQALYLLYQEKGDLESAERWLSF